MMRDVAAQVDTLTTAGMSGKSWNIRDEMEDDVWNSI